MTDLLSDEELGKIPFGALKIAEMLAAAGFQSWIVGGCVRDLLRGEKPSDWDLCTTATPDEIMKVFPRTVPTGIEHGTVTVLFPKSQYEVTTLRGEGAYTDGRHPDSVEFTTDLTRDLARRDFTINAMAVDLTTGIVHDPFHGLDDLQNKVIRCVGDPMERFAEDGLRILRAARFCATLGFDLDKKTEAAIVLNVETFVKVSMERVHAEIVKMFTKADQPSRGLKVMDRTGLLADICPVIKKFRPEAVDGQKKDFVLRMATFLHEGRVTAAQADAWLRSFKTSNADRERIVRILDMYTPAYNMTPEEWRKWASRVGRPHIQDLLDSYWPESMHKAILLVLKDAPLSVKDLVITGHDVLAAGVESHRGDGLVDHV